MFSAVIENDIARACFFDFKIFYLSCIGGSFVSWVGFVRVLLYLVHVITTAILDWRGQKQCWAATTW